METFTPEQVRQHLQRILATPSFSDSLVLTRFLSFIVNETLEGRSHELKEYTIAIDALKKDADFNPQIDSIVRIHAGRLRRALKEFYYEAGANEEMQIHVRKGSYVPAFVANSVFVNSNGRTDSHALLTVSKGMSQNHKNSLAVLTFEDISETKTHACFVRGLDVYLRTCLTHNPQLAVVSDLSSAHLPVNLKDIHEAGCLLNASFILTGCVQFDKHLRVHVLLNACETGEQLWGMTIDKRDVEMTDLFALQDEIVNTIASAVNQVVSGPASSNQKVMLDQADQLQTYEDNRKVCLS
jgi:TolB-like protein